MGKNALLLVNPISGKGESAQKIMPVCSRLGKDGWKTVVHVSQSRGDITNVILEQSADYELIVTMGGDGTLNETVTGIVRSGWKGDLGYIPAGSVNDFAASQKLPKDAVQAAEIIAAGHTRQIDVGRFCDRYFTYVAAFGMFTDVPYTTPQQKKNELGKMAYLLEGAKNLGNLPSFRISYEQNGKFVNDEVVLGLVANSRSVAGIALGDSMGADLSDGLFEVLLIRSSQLTAEVGNIIRALIARNFDDKNLVFFKTPYLHISCPDAIAWTLDGEYGGTLHETVIENLNKAINIIVPEN